MLLNDSANNQQNVNELSLMAPVESQCVPWLAVFIVECLAIVTFNFLIIVVFVKKRQLQRRSTYLIFHLLVVQLLLGAVAGPGWIVEDMSLYCYQRDYQPRALYWFFKTSSEFTIVPCLNLFFISLERAHATFRPFRHRFVKKWIYAVIIVVIWLVYGGMLVAKVIAFTNDDNSRFAWSTSRFFPLCILCISYVSIFIKLRCSRRPQHYGAVGVRERKLTQTLFLITLTSIFTCLPIIIYSHLSSFGIHVNISQQPHFHVYMALLVIYLAGSLTHPILYALRSPGVRAGVSQLFRRK